MTNPNIRKINKLYILHSCACTFESSLINMLWSYYLLGNGKILFLLD